MLNRQEDSLADIDTSKITILEVMLKTTYGKSSSDYEDMRVFEALKVTMYVYCMYVHCIMTCLQADRVTKRLL